MRWLLGQDASGWGGISPHSRRAQRLRGTPSTGIATCAGASEGTESLAWLTRRQLAASPSGQ